MSKIPTPDYSELAWERELQRNPELVEEIQSVKVKFPMKSMPIAVKMDVKQKTKRGGRGNLITKLKKLRNATDDLSFKQVCSDNAKQLIVASKIKE